MLEDVWEGDNQGLRGSVLERSRTLHLIPPVYLEMTGDFHKVALKQGTLLLTLRKLTCKKLLGILARSSTYSLQM